MYNVHFSKVLRFADLPITKTCNLLVLVARLPKATVIPSFKKKNFFFFYFIFFTLLPLCQHSAELFQLHSITDCNKIVIINEKAA